MPWLFLILSLAGAALTYNVYRPVYSHRTLSGLSFVAGFAIGELALHWIALQALVSAGLIAAGALAAWPGQLGLGLTALSWTGLAVAHSRAGRAAEVVERALAEALGGDLAPGDAPPGWRVIARPFPIRHRDVERIGGIVYAREDGRELKLDVYRPRARPAGCPVLLQIHGGAWVFGTRRTQALPLMYHMASRGWVCVSVDYRLSPRATFPAHLVDCKRALAWIRERGPAYGADPGFVVVTGGSAGGHLAALLALTPGDPEYQPGFEDVDTRVQGCVPFYGVYDLVDRHGDYRHRGLHQLLERMVIKAPLETARDAYERASPVARIGPHAPPFFVVHGDRDSLVPVASARRFAAALRERSSEPVAYAEIPGGQHAFELFPSLRALCVVYAAGRFCDYLRERARQGEAPAAAG